MARTCKNKFYENKIKLNWLNLFKNFLLRYNCHKVPPVSDSVKIWNNPEPTATIRNKQERVICFSKS